MSKYFMVLDTETAGDVNKRSTLRVYDFGWVVTNTKGEPMTRKSFVIDEVFTNDELMGSAYYADKLPRYREGLTYGKWVSKSFIEARAAFLADMVQYRCTEVYAYNCRFDEGALNATMRSLSNGYTDAFVPKSVEWRDIWGYAQDTICATPQYVRWAVDNGALTPTGRISTTAEAVYRYLTKDSAFIEAHTAADDAAIESYILHRARHMPRKGSFEWHGAKTKVLNSIRKELGI